MQNDRTKKGTAGVMNHPTPEQRVSYLYKELSKSEKTQFENHIRDCEPCRKELQAEEETILCLSTWNASKKNDGSPFYRWVPLAAAALVALGVGLFAGNSYSQSAKAALKEQIQAQVMAELKPQMIRELRGDLESTLRKTEVNLQEEFNRKAEKIVVDTLASARQETEKLLAEYSRENGETRLNDQTALVAALQQMEAKRVADLRSLRRELETVAVLTQDGFEKAQNQLVQLSSYQQTAPK